MTREQAINKVRLHETIGADFPLKLVEALQALGILELDDLKGPKERAVDAMFCYPPCKHGLITPRHALEALDAAGLKIVEK